MSGAGVVKLGETLAGSLLTNYTPFWGLRRKCRQISRWQVVCFTHSFCDGSCAHCWSKDTFLGRMIPLSWHERFWKHVDPSRLEEVRITGGEPFLYKDIGKLLGVVRGGVGESVPIRVFTNGKRFVSLEKGKRGVEETVDNLARSGVVNSNVEIHLSCDEHHGGALYRSIAGVRQMPRRHDQIKKMNERGIQLLRVQARNFLEACDILASDQRLRFRGGKLKVHTEKGRLGFHRSVIFNWLDDREWRNKVIATEGLIQAGNSRLHCDSEKLRKDAMLSLFLLPGAEFYEEPVTKYAQGYFDREERRLVYLDTGRADGHGACIVGWTNIVDRRFCGGTAYDSLCLIGRR